jgi:hypothetical protein
MQGGCQHRDWSGVRTSDFGFRGSGVVLRVSFFVFLGFGFRSSGVVFRGLGSGCMAWRS